MKLDKREASFESKDSQHDDEIEYWSQAPIEEKIGMITYLRECFYGTKATTGRLPRLFRFSKQEQS